MRAYEILQRYGHVQADIEHMLLALLEQPEGSVPEILKTLAVDIEELRERIDDILLRVPKSGSVPNLAVGQVYITPRLKRVMAQAEDEAKKLKDDYISTEHLFLAIVNERGTTTAKIMGDLGITPKKSLEAIGTLRGGERVTSKKAEKRYRALEKYSRDLTKLAADSKLDPVIGRNTEILRVIQVLSRRTKNNPVLIGEAGVGKTAIVEGLAQQITDDDALDEVQRSDGEIILFIDELHTVVGAGAAQGAMDASNMMKPALARGELQCVGATTLNEYKKYIEKDAALERRFSPVFVNEPSVEETIQMLGGVSDRYEAHHRITYSPEALESAARLSHRYVTDRRLPDKAIDLIDEAASKVRLAIYSMPPELKGKRKALTKIQREEAESSGASDAARACGRAALQ